MPMVNYCCVECERVPWRSRLLRLHELHLGPSPHETERTHSPLLSPFWDDAWAPQKRPLDADLRIIESDRRSPPRAQHYKALCRTTTDS